MLVGTRMLQTHLPECVTVFWAAQEASTAILCLFKGVNAGCLFTPKVPPFGGDIFFHLEC